MRFLPLYPKVLLNQSMVQQTARLLPGSESLTPIWNLPPFLNESVTKATSIHVRISKNVCLDSAW